MIIGLSEIRRAGQESISLPSGNDLCYSSNSTKKHGVDFMVKKSLVEKVTGFRGISDRITELTIQIKKTTQIQLIQVYMPTCSNSDEEVELIYENVNKLLQKKSLPIIIVMGDFNAKIGIGESNEQCTGNYGSGLRNTRGQMLINFAQCNTLKIINTLYKKQTNRRWTWVSPIGETKNEIDYILSNKSSLITNASIINQFNIGNDHRLLRAKLSINIKLERLRMVRRNKPPYLQNLSAQKQEFEIQLKYKFKSLNLNDPINTLEAKITDSINTAAVKVARKSKNKESTSYHQQQSFY